MTVEDALASKRLLEAAQNRALDFVSERRRELVKAQELYEGAVLHADALGCGATAIGERAQLSEAAIRGFLRRRPRGGTS